VDRRAEISQIVIGLAEYYDKQLSVSQLAMYVEDLIDLSPKDLVDAVCRYRRDSKNERFPLPSKLRAALPQGGGDPESEAASIASRIAGAVSRIGPYQVPLAKSYIGELGWAVVKSEGGWEEVCQSYTYENQGTLKAQWRNLAKSFLNKQPSNVLSLTNSKEKPKGLASMGDMFKSISDQATKGGIKNDNT
jgi:hypothetical protein